MSNQTVSTNLNFDSSSISGLANGDNLTIDSGAVLTIDSDVRWGQNAAVIGAITIDSTTGGKVTFDGTKVWWIPFDASSGNVPSLGTVGTPDVTRSGSNVGEFLGVWTALGVAPSAAGGAMPASGFVKLRTKSVTLADNDVLTFAGGATITINSSTGGQRGWIHIVGEEATTITLPRVGTLEGLGDFFQIGETDGTDDQTFQYPVADNCPVMYIEDGAGGYEIWLNAGSRWGNATPTVSQDVRGKFFGCVNSTGVITIARRATNACGYKPPSGRKVYIPNIIISSSTSADWAANTISSTVTTRWDVTTTNGGYIDLTRVTGTWNIRSQYASGIEMTECGFIDNVYVDNISDLLLDSCGIGAEGTGVPAGTPLQITYTRNTIIRGCAIVRGQTDANARVTVSLAVNESLLLQDSTITVFQAATANTRVGASQSAIYAYDSQGVTLENINVIGGDLSLENCSVLAVSGIRYAYLPNADTDSTNPSLAAVLLTACRRFTVSDFANYGELANVHPYAVAIGIYIGSKSGIVENIGTAAAEYDCGSASACGYVVSLTGAHYITVRRVYAKNVRTAVISFALAGVGAHVTNVWGDDATSILPSGRDDIKIRGCRWTNSVTASGTLIGLHWLDLFTSTTTGRLVLTGYTPTALTAAQCEASSGVVFSNVAGTVFSTTGDNATWTMDYFMLGHTAFANAAPTLTGTNTNLLTMEFQYDIGDGWNGSWLTLDGATLSGLGSFSATTGIKIKVKATKTTGAVANLIYCRIDTVTDATSRKTQHPLENSRDNFTIYNLLAIDSSDITVLQMLSRVVP